MFLHIISVLILCYGVQSVYPQPCTGNSIYESINITDGFLYENDIIFNNVVYDPRFYFVANQSYDYATGEIINVKDHVRGCLCDIPDHNCIRLCCPLNHVYVNKVKRCVLKPNIPLKQYQEIAKSNAIVIGKPCKQMYQLEPELFDDDEFTFSDNGEFILYNADNKVYRHHDSCLAVFQDTETSEIIFKANICYETDECDNCDLNEKPLGFYPYALIISIVFLAMIILIYSFEPDLRNLHGKCVLCYVCGLCLAYTMLAYQRFNPDTQTTLCVVFGFSGIYSFIFSFLWLNAMSVDSYWTFKGLTSSKRMSDDRKFIIYSAYTWGITLVLLLLAIALQFSDASINFGPGIGETGCWIKKQWKFEFTYLYLPIMIIVAINTTLFIITALHIKHLKNDSDHNERGGDINLIKENTTNFSLFLWLFIVMGFAWIFEIISWITEINYGEHWISDILNICSALQGVLVFIIVLWNPKVKLLIVKRYRIIRGLEAVPVNNYNGNANLVAINDH